MNSSALRPAIQLLRPFNVLVMMIVIAAAVGLASDGPPDLSALLIAACVGGCIGGAANTINDYFDIGIDRINKPSRPLARRALSPEWAYMQWLVLTVLGISLNLFLTSSALLVALSAAVVLYVYSARLKKTVLLGNIAVAAMTALALLYGAIVAGDPQRAVIPAVFAFLINFGREIVKDVEDREGDLGGNARTFPVRFGVRKSLALATGVLLLLIASTIVAYNPGRYNRLYVVLVGVVDVSVLYSIVSMWKDTGPKNLGTISMILKLNMVVGLAAVYLGVQ